MRISHNMYMLVAGSSILTFAIQLLAFPGLMSWGAFDRMVQVLAALGTVGAVWWAMRSSTLQQAEKSRREIDEAIILAAGMIDLLEQALKRLNAVSANITFTHIPADDYHSNMQFAVNKLRDDLYEALNSPAFAHGFETISKLSPLPNKCAIRLYKARSKVRTIQHDIGNEKGGSTWNSLTVDHRLELLIRSTAQVQDVIDYVRNVTDDMRMAALNAGVELTDEERYGFGEGDDFSDQD